MAMPSSDLMTVDEKEGVYALAHGFLVNGRLRESEDLMTLLLTIDPVSTRFWSGLGAVQRARGNLPGAAVAFGVAAQLDPEDELAALNLGETWLALSEPRLARRSLKQVAGRGVEAAGARAKALLRRCEEEIDGHQ
jgi:Flp pilus assembly protein TadD